MGPVVQPVARRSAEPDRYTELGGDEQVTRDPVFGQYGVERIDA
jgi:hypothetical protein